MIVRTAPERPKEFAFAFGNWRIIDAGNTPPHQTALVELPILIAIGAEPAAAIVAPLIGKAHRDAVFAEGPKLFLITHEPQPISGADTAWAWSARWPSTGAGSWRRDRIAG